FHFLLYDFQVALIHTSHILCSVCIMLCSATRKMINAVKPNVVFSCNGDNHEDREISFKLGEEFEETTADGRSVVTLDKSSVNQVQKRDGKGHTIKGKVENSKLLVECVIP
uniref:Uncharacterized protein n=1 Tax=Varanus komodoensis TaxID=61221 RepID=A0A8D2LJL4_VARKO